MWFRGYKSRQGVASSLATCTSARVCARLLRAPSCLASSIVLAMATNAVSSCPHPCDNPACGSSICYTCAAQCLGTIRKFAVGVGAVRCIQVELSMACACEVGNFRASTNVHIHACLCAHTHTHTSIRINKDAHRCAYTCTYVHVIAYTCMCMYVHVYYV